MQLYVLCKAAWLRVWTMNLISKQKENKGREREKNEIS